MPDLKLSFFSFDGPNAVRSLVSFHSDFHRAALEEYGHNSIYRVALLACVLSTYMVCVYMILFLCLPPELLALR